MKREYRAYIIGEEQMIKLDLQFFGGRGASSGGRVGGGGVNPADIKSMTSMVSERERQQAAVDEVLSVAQDFESEFGITVEDWQLAEIDPKAGVLGFASRDGVVAINQDYFGEKMNKPYADSVASGFHPSNGNKTALQAVAAHELGHRINGVIAAKTGQDFDAVATKVVSDARKTTGHKGVVQMARKISGYATHSNAETIAEAVADVYCNGKKARTESHAIVSSLKSYLKS